MWVIIILAILVGIIMAVIRIKDENKNPTAQKHTPQIDPKDYVKMTDDEFADYLLDTYVPGQPVKSQARKQIKSMYDRKKTEAIVKYEYPSHKRILEDSVRLIQSTNNLETLVERYNRALENYLWIKEKISLGVPIFFKSHGNFPDELKELTNFHIERVARSKYDSYLNIVSTLKTEKAKENHKEKLREFLNECTDSLKKTENTEKWISKINNLRNKL